MKTLHKHLGSICLAVLFACTATALDAAEPWVVYDGFSGPGNGKHIVLISGDEEYRSEQALPQLGKILAKRHGFKCTVLFAIGPDGTIDPVCLDNIPGLENLQTADLMIIFTRFRNLPDNQMKYIDQYVRSGKPIIGMRTATHAFKLAKNSPYAYYSFRSQKKWIGGFGRHVLGETWISHHGHHGKQSTRGIIAPGQKNHPIVRGIHDGDIWGPTDVYTVRLPLPGDSQPIILGQVLEGMTPDAKPVVGPQNDPMLPVAWTRTFAAAPHKKARVFTTTMGASQDLLSEGVRRMLVNACYWALGMEDQIPPKSNVDLVGPYHPTPFGFGKFEKGVRPQDLALKPGEK